MSGRKCSNVTISQSSYNKLRSNVRRADDAASTARREAERARAKNKEMQLDFRRRQDAMQREFRRSVSDLSDAVKQSELRQEERLNALRGEVFENLEAQRRAFSVALDEHRAEVSQELSAVRDEIATDKELQRSYAAQRMSDLEQLLAALSKNEAHERFAPGELEALERRVQDARTSMELGQYQAAFSSAQERYYDYQELRVRIAEREALWTARLDLALRQSEVVAGEISSANDARYKFGETDEVEVAAEVEFWSEGRLGELVGEHDRITKILSDPKSLNADELDTIHQSLHELQGGIISTVALARERLIQSQHRRDIAEAVLESFNGTMWELADNDYEAEDMRRGLHLKMSNDADEEIVISVSPVESDDGGITTVVEVNFFDQGNDERLRAARLAEMRRSMQNQGVNVEGFQCLDNSVGKPGMQSRRDFERLRQPDQTSITL